MKPDGYTNLYFDLIAELKHQSKWDMAKRWFSLLLGLSWLLALILSLLNLPVWVLIFFATGLGLTIFFSLIWLLFWIGYIAWAGSRDPVKLMPEFTAKLLTVTKRPYSDERGLGIAELDKLHQIAILEQGAADWRGNFINLIVVGIFLGSLTIIVNPPEAFYRIRSFIQQSNEIAIEPGTIRQLPNILPTWAEATNSVIGFALIIVLVFIVIRQLFLYLDRFIATESANRTILFATKEAAYLLEHASLHQANTLTLDEKRALALMLGYRLRIRQDFDVPLFVDKNNDWWHLDRISNIPKIDKRRGRWYIVQSWILDKLNRLRKKR